MNFTVKTFDPNKNIISANSFFIQSKGYNSGRPLREPKVNCWQIETDIEFAFEILTVLWLSKYYHPHLCGSVIPFLKIRDFKKLVNPVFCASSKIDFKAHFQTLQGIEELITNTQSKLKLINSLKISTANQLLKELSPFV